VVWIAIAVGIASLYPKPVFPELRPLVREMLENLGAVNQIGEGLALESPRSESIPTAMPSSTHT
jgi:hypothetical protein